MSVYGVPVIVDNGSGICKAGLADSDFPKAIFPTIIGHTRLQRYIGSDSKEVYIGDEVLCSTGFLSFSYPIENGYIKNWDDMERIWSYTFTKELQIQTDEHPILITEPPLNPKENKEKMVQIMFETFNFQGFYAAVQAVLPIYSVGIVTGIVYDSGDGVTQILPVYEGYCLVHNIMRVDIGGRNVTNYLANLLTESGNYFNSNAEREVVRQIKEKLCYVAEDYNEEMCRNDDVEAFYELPDGRSLRLGHERYRAPECLFNPNLIGLDIGGVGNAIYQCIMKSDLDIRKVLCENFILSGGSTMFPGLKGRITKEINRIIPTSLSLKVNDDPDRKYSVWKGGAILSKISSFESRWVTKEEYEEYGPSIVHRKCF